MIRRLLAADERQDSSILAAISLIIGIRAGVQQYENNEAPRILKS